MLSVINTRPKFNLSNDVDGWDCLLKQRIWHEYSRYVFLHCLLDTTSFCQRIVQRSGLKSIPILFSKSMESFVCKKRHLRSITPTSSVTFHECFSVSQAISGLSLHWISTYQNIWMTEMTPNATAKCCARRMTSWSFATYDSIYLIMESPWTGAVGILICIRGVPFNYRSSQHRLVVESRHLCTPTVVLDPHHSVNISSFS